MGKTAAVTVVYIPLIDNFDLKEEAS